MNRPSEALFKVIQAIAEPNGYTALLDVANEWTRIRVEFKHATDSRLNWTFTSTRRGNKSSLEVFRDTFVPACRAAGFIIPMDAEHQQPMSCKVCGGERVSIRGQHPGADNRIVCPTCLADTIDDLRRRISPDWPHTGEVKK